MMHELLVTRAQPVQSGFAGGRRQKTMFRAFAVAGKEYVATETAFGKRIVFGIPEFVLLIGVRQFDQRDFAQIA